MIKCFIIIVLFLMSACSKPQDGLNGTAGSNGNGCTLTTVSPSSDAPNGGALVSCGGISVLIFNGAPGVSAAAYTIVATVDPCGPSGGHDEVFLRMASGALVALFSDNASGDNSRLSYTNDGVNYVTTDGQYCMFNVATTSGTRTITWTSPVSGSESWPIY